MRKIVCINCSKEFEYKFLSRSIRKFCSSNCSASFNNIGVNRHPKSKTAQISVKECKHCGVEFLPKNRNVCHCNDCIETNAYGNKKSRLADACTDKTRRRILIESCGRKCFVCLNETWNNQPIPLELDHIDGDSENNSDENLRLVCPNCHALTETYKGKNKGNGRHIRLQRYKDGLSY